MQNVQLRIIRIVRTYSAEAIDSRIVRVFFPRSVRIGKRWSRVVMGKFVRPALCLHACPELP